MRIMELAERFGLPVVSFVDVPGAHPGPESEERGIADAIARSIAVQIQLRTPIVAIITGEGGSGGALAIAVGDVVIALENAVYSVISPEGCASILWRTADEAPAAALAMRMTAIDQQALGVVDVVVPEPGEGAHTDHGETARRLRRVILQHLEVLERIPVGALVDSRYRRYRELGGRLQPILDTIAWLHRAGVWVEIVTLLIPGFNDSDAELRGLAAFIAGVSPDIPWHVTAFHQDYRMTDPANTTPAMLLRAAQIGRDAGLHYIYAGNLPGRVGELEHTVCHTCGTRLIARYGYFIQEYNVTSDGSCPSCATPVPGRWSHRFEGQRSAFPYRLDPDLR